MPISNFEYMFNLSYPAWLWIKKNAKYLLSSADNALQTRFNEGRASEPSIEAQTEHDKAAAYKMVAMLVNGRE